MKSPAFQFYTKDWRTNLKLRRCSEAARGAWVDILCALHDGEEYGVARFLLSELASVSGASMKSIRELVAKGVLKGGDADVPALTYAPRHGGKVLPAVTLLNASEGPMWYSSRMVRDEWLRGRRGESTRFTPDNNPNKKRQGEPPTRSPTHREGVDNPSPTRRHGEPQGDGAASASAVAVPITTALQDGYIPASDGPTSKAVGSGTPQPPDHATRIEAACREAGLTKPTRDNPIVARWIEKATPSQVTLALADGRRTVHHPKPMSATYVDPILERILEEDRKARAAADAGLNRTQAQVAEQATWKTTPPTEAAAKFIPPRKAAAA